jgi:uncharacterized Zn finger protein (UPF0148 family)
METIVKLHNPKTIWELMTLMNLSHARYYYDKLNRELITRKITTLITLKCTSCGTPLLSKGGITGLCNTCVHITQRKADRPTKEAFIELLKKSNPLAISKQYGVSDNAIRKWMISYGIPKKKKEWKAYVNAV